MMVMEIVQQIESDLTQAQKAKNEVEVLTLRGAKAAIKNIEIAKRPDELTEADVVKTLRTEIKRRLEAVELYQQGERPDLVKKELAEIKIIAKYLPKELSDGELKKIGQGVVAKLGAVGPADFGKVMGAVMKEVAGRAEGGRVGAMVKKALVAQNS